MRFIWFLLVLSGCSGIEESQHERIKQNNEYKELIHRSSKDWNYPKAEIKSQSQDPYPWQDGYEGLYAKITKEAFRCRGDIKRPPKIKEDSSNQLIHDCGGGLKHSLPIKGGKEFIYPILIDLLNYIQLKTGNPVIVTCGHRCPAHNAYSDSSIYNLSSKHMMGAEVDFYVEGKEDKPEEIIDLILSYYKEKEPYKKNKEYEQFLRLDSVKLNVETPPWYNKEVLIKLYKKEEGRDLDNQHPYPYLCLQVRFDREKNEKVTYLSEKALSGYMRY